MLRAFVLLAVAVGLCFAGADCYAKSSKSPYSTRHYSKGYFNKNGKYVSGRMGNNPTRSRQTK